MFGLFRKELITVRETSLSKFIREASSADKKRIYGEVLRKASERQLKVLEEVDQRRVNAGNEK